MALVWQVVVMHRCTVAVARFLIAVEILLAAAQRWQPVWLLVCWLLVGCWVGDLDHGDPV
jgi:hypothetical protein